MTHTRVTTAAELAEHEIVRIDHDVVKVTGLGRGTLTYRGEAFDVTYVSGVTEAGPILTTVLSDRVLIAGH